MALLCGLCFLLGIISGYQYSFMISWVNIAIILAAFFLIFTSYRRSLVLIVMCFIVGFCISKHRLDQYNAWQLPQKYEGKLLLLRGVIESMPMLVDGRNTFHFRLSECSCLGEPFTCNHALVRLSTTFRKVVIGEKWVFAARLKRIHGLQNLIGSSALQQALQQGVQASGYVDTRVKPQHIPSEDKRPLFSRLRQRLTKSLTNQLPKGDASHWLLALMTGVRQGIPAEHWQTLRRTGTNHLMAIAGLHMGAIAAFIYYLASRHLRRFASSSQNCRTQKLANLVALLFAGFYAGIAGWSLPTQRAFVMLLVLVLTSTLSVRVSSWVIITFALVTVLILQPFAFLSDSFWLSFVTIALLIYCMRGRLSPTGWWWRWGHVQWAISVGLLPLSFILFQEASLISFVTNSFAIPFLTVFILPFTFLATIFAFMSTSLTHAALCVANLSMTYLWQVLTYFSSAPFATWSTSIFSSFSIVCLVVAVLLLLLPRGMSGKWCACAWLLPLALYEPQLPSYGHYQVLVLDVGQGLSVLVQTKHHNLLYDAGPKFSSQLDMGERVVLPTLRYLSVKKLDMLVISHGDNDHIGGADTILKNLPVSLVETSVPEKIHYASVDYCLDGKSWEWDGVSFKYLYPSLAEIGLGNDSSCVLLIDNGNDRVMLPGDIERKAEHLLLTRHSGELGVTLLLAPHHGSKTSIAHGFVAAVKPRHVVYATGYRNRYHLPHPKVVAAYERIGAKAKNTANEGVISYRF